MEKKTLTEEAAFNRLAFLCAKTEYCLQDMRRKMSAWQLPEGGENRILQRLLKERYVDENRYARAFVRDKFRYNRWGSAKIAQALRMKGISDDDIREGLEEITTDDQLETLKNLLTQKRRTITYKSDYDLYSKLLRFAVSRGFSIDQARKCITDIENIDTDDINL